MTDTDKAHQKAYQKAYRKSDAYKAYQKSDAYKAYYKAYHQTAAYKAYHKAYQKSDAYKAYYKAYYQTAAYKAYQKAYKKAYYQTAAYKAYHKAYRKSDAYKAYHKAHRLLPDLRKHYFKLKAQTEKELQKYSLPPIPLQGKLQSITDILDNLDRIEEYAGSLPSTSKVKQEAIREMVENLLQNEGNLVSWRKPLRGGMRL